MRNHDNKSSHQANSFNSVDNNNSSNDNNNNNKTSNRSYGRAKSQSGGQMHNNQRLKSSTTTASSAKGSSKMANQPKASKTVVKSPSNKALLQSDPLFHLYLICVGLITLSILAIKCLIPGMPIYMHTMIGFAFLLAIIVASTIYTQAKSRKVSISAYIKERFFEKSLVLRGKVSVQER